MQLVFLASPCAQLYDPPYESGLGGWYNGVVILLVSPEVPSDVESNVQTLATKLLELKHVKVEKHGPVERRCVHHVITVPCGMSRREAFFASDRTARCWRAITHGGVAVSEHRHLRPILEPLMTAAGEDPFFVGADGGPVVELS